MLSHKKQQIPIKYLPLCALLRNVHNHDHQTYLSQNLSQTYGAALPRINTVQTDIFCSSSGSKLDTLILGMPNIIDLTKDTKCEISPYIAIDVPRVESASSQMSKPNPLSRTKTFCNLDKYIWLFGQIPFLIRTNTFLSQEWRVPAAECPNQTLQAELHRLLSCLCQQLILQLLSDFF